MDLPVKIFNKVAEDLKPMDRILLRQVSPSLQSFCDKLGPKFKKIELIMKANLNGFVLGKEEIEYKPLENGYVMSCNGVNAILKDGDWLDGMWNGLMACFNSENPKYAQRISPELIFNVKSVHFMCTYLEDGPQLLLPLLQPGYLENIEMRCSDDNVTYEKLAKTEQWKLAKTVRTDAGKPLKPDQLQYFRHLDQFDIKMDDLTLDELIALMRVS
ncbi:hypothetical protein CAEBREN_01783 [Caenorhabditis brenneri]|uniref:F-box domain-containing protein n=1 Tax=Caenorhabditis brenneri TaxID=135651 RepID=G0PMJ2_CAEBE|nr:hypothetical protein CAEBREN_01783 [Caenorhabditis brenneri]